MRARLGVLLVACALTAGADARADDSTHLETSTQIEQQRWDARPWALTGFIGLSMEGQLGAELERSLSRHLAVSAGMGVDLLSSFPYDAQVRGRYTLSGKLRGVTGAAAYGLRLALTTGEDAYQADHAIYEDLGVNVSGAAEAYVEVRGAGGFMGRFAMGVGRRLANEVCEGWCQGDELRGQVHGIVLSLAFGTAF